MLLKKKKSSNVVSMDLTFDLIFRSIFYFSSFYYVGIGDAFLNSTCLFTGSKAKFAIFSCGH